MRNFRPSALSFTVDDLQGCDRVHFRRRVAIIDLLHLAGGNAAAKPTPALPFEFKWLE